MTPFPYTLQQTTIDDFAENGYVVTDGVLGADEVRSYGDAVDVEVARRTAHDTREVAEKTRYEQSFIQCMRLWETSRAVRPLTCHRALAGIAAQLLGVTSVRLWQDQALYKESGGLATTPHQDLTFWPFGHEPLISAWIPFDDITIAAGAMAYVPGSHKAGRLRVVDITHATTPYDIVGDPALGGASPAFQEVSAGSITWHHGLTVHQASANTTDKTRRVFTIVYIAAQARRTQSWPAYPLDRDHVGVGDVIDGPGMPVLWPPGESMPTPPPNPGVAVGAQMRVNAPDRTS